MFWSVPVPINRSFPLYIRHWYMSCKFDDRFQAGLGWNCSSISESVGFVKKKFVTMHGHMNVKVLHLDVYCEIMQHLESYMYHKH